MVECDPSRLALLVFPRGCCGVSIGAISVKFYICDFSFFKDFRANTGSMSKKYFICLGPNLEDLNQEPRDFIIIWYRTHHVPRVVSWILGDEIRIYKE